MKRSKTKATFNAFKILSFSKSFNSIKTKGTKERYQCSPTVLKNERKKKKIIGITKTKKKKLNPSSNLFLAKNFVFIRIKKKYGVKIRKRDKK